VAELPWELKSLLK